MTKWMIQGKDCSDFKMRNKKHVVTNKLLHQSLNQLKFNSKIEIASKLVSPRLRRILNEFVTFKDSGDILIIKKLKK